jgi:hypothetical protein
MIDRPLVTPDTMGGLSSAVIPAFAAPSLSSTTRELPDGSVEIYLGPIDEMRMEQAPFSANLAEYLPENTLQGISTSLRHAIEEDKSSRRDWEDALAKGMELLGIKTDDRTIPWPGACGVVHPMILEAAVRFQSKSITRLFPAEGPASAKVIGEGDEEKIQQAKRVATDINHWLTEKMPEYRDEMEQLLFALPVDGSAFKKVYFDVLLKRPVSQFVPASDFLMPYGFPNLETCPRYTHVLKMAYGDITRLQANGFFRDISINRSPLQLGEVEEKVVRLGGLAPSYTMSDLVTLWESHVNLSIEGDAPAPYVVTMEYDNHNILSIYRNWRENDPQRSKVQSFTHYRYVPWKGAYGLAARGNSQFLR